MRRFLHRLLLFASLQIVIGSIWWTQHEPFAEDYMAATLDKHARLKREPPPRIILVGGSAAAFGFDSAAIEDRLALTPVNMGLHFGVGSSFMLSEVQHALKAGDVVVLSLEYGHFEEDPKAGSLLDVLGHRPSAIHYVGGSVVPQLSDQLLPYLATQLRIDLRRALGRLRPAELPYRRSAFNKYGDVVEHWGRAPRNPNLNFVLGRLSESSLRRMSATIEGFAASAAAHPAQVYISFPPIPADGCEAARHELDKIWEASERIHGVVRLSLASSECYPRTLFYDTFYHLNREGARRRSRELADALIAQGVPPRVPAREVPAM